MHRWTAAWLVAAMVTASGAHANLEAESWRERPWMELAGPRVAPGLPCVFGRDVNTGLPPCAVPPTPAEKARERFGQLQQICQNIRMANGFVTLCSSVGR
jgi:hypothetical protein